MAEQLLNKLSNFEIAPPVQSWENISGILDREYDPSEIRLANRLSKVELAPPEMSWESIYTSLYSTSPAKSNPGRIISIPFIRVATAAVFLGIISITAFYLLNRNLPTSVQEQASVFPISPPQNSLTESDIPETNPHSTESPLSSSASTIPNQSGIRHIKSEPAVQYAEVIHPEESFPVQYSTIDEETLRVSPSKQITVDAPPIRDDKGNIIMDLKLVSTANQQYVIVTSPNGEQTRISRKFAAMLSYLNEEAVPINFSIDGLEWKFRFQAWRDKLLEQASFIPTAANYLDIFELKNLIDEN